MHTFQCLIAGTALLLILIQVNVTWVYLSRAREWEQALPAAVFAAAVSDKDPNCTDPTVLPSRGAFKNFPHYDTGGQIEQTASMANLLGNLAGWTIKANEALFRRAILGA